LRLALDALKSNLDRLFAARGKEVFRDPWAARDAYVQVLLDRSADSVRDFLGRHGLRSPDALVPEALWLLEMQRHGLYMYTSCGWFFDEISGLETTQCLRYAARAIQLARHFGQEFENDFAALLEKAPSNLPEFGNGRKVWEQLIRPSRVDLDRVLAHYATSLIYGDRDAHARVYCYDLTALDQEVRDRDTGHLALGRLHVRSRLTGNEAETVFTVIHYGGLDFHAALRKSPRPLDYVLFKQKLLETYDNGSLAEVTAYVHDEFESGEAYHLDDLFIEERRRIIDILLAGRFEDYRHEFERLADQDEATLKALARMHYPIPRTLLTAASLGLDQKLAKEIGADGDGLPDRVGKVLERGRPWGYKPDTLTLSRRLLEQLLDVLNGIHPDADLEALTARAGDVLDVAARLGATPDLWRAQNRLLDAFAEVQAAGPVTPALREAFAKLAQRLSVSPDLLGWRP
jgi:hypothetical protein